MYQVRTKVAGYAESMIPSYLLDNFQGFFRISKGTFKMMLTDIAVPLMPEVTRERGP